jgi:hypothetical protein
VRSGERVRPACLAERPPGHAAGRRRVDQSADREAGVLQLADRDQAAPMHRGGLVDTPRPGGPETVLTEEVSDKSSDYGSGLQQTQRDVTRHRDPSELR